MSKSTSIAINKYSTFYISNILAIITLIDFDIYKTNDNVLHFTRLKLNKRYILLHTKLSYHKFLLLKERFEGLEFLFLLSSFLHLTCKSFSRNIDFSIFPQLLLSRGPWEKSTEKKQKPKKSCCLFVNGWNPLTAAVQKKKTNTNRRCVIPKSFIFFYNNLFTLKISLVWYEIGSKAVISIHSYK